jgi:hypothetical protein
MPIEKRMVAIILDDEQCKLHLEIISCEKQINDLIEYLSHKYCMKQLYVDKKDKI